jgi:uncharacterized RDD family membrane protein YckC
MDVIAVPSIPLSSGTQMQGKKFWPRAASYGVDMLCIYGLTYLIGLGVGSILWPILYMIAGSMGRELTYVQNNPCGNFVFGLTQTIIYFAFFEWLYGRTLGKVLFGFRVVSADGSSINIKQAFIRSVYRLIDGFFFGIVAYTNMKPPQYQRLGDQNAGTLVVAASDPEIKEKPDWWKFFEALVVFMVIDSLILALSVLVYIRFT